MSSGLPENTIAPLFIIRMRWATLRANERFCSTTRNVCPSVFSFLMSAPNFTDNQGAQSFGRLVHQENIGILYQRSRNCEHLLLAAGQRTAARGSPRIQAGKRLINRIQFPTSGACSRQRQLDIFNHRQRRKYPMALRHPADAAANNLVGRKSRYDVSAQPNFAVTRRWNTENALQRRRFADAIAAENADHLSRKDVERQTMKNMAFAIKRIDVMQREQRLGHNAFPM